MKKTWRAAAERTPASRSPFPSACYDERVCVRSCNLCICRAGYAFRRHERITSTAKGPVESDNGSATYLFSCGEEAGMIYFHPPRESKREGGGRRGEKGARRGRPVVPATERKTAYRKHRRRVKTIERVLSSYR